MQAKADVQSGRGTGFILKDVYLKYIRPVTWPDTVRHLPFILCAIVRERELMHR
jgi:hypothetical protein